MRRALSYEPKHPQNRRAFLHPVVHLAVTPPGGRKIDGEYQHLRTCRNGSFDHALDETTVFEHVELEPRGNTGLLRNLVHIAPPHGRQRKRNPNRLRRIGRFDFAATRVHSGHTDGPQDDWQ